MAKVLVVTRTKNRTLLLERTLMSVANQTYTDYEHLIYNNGGDKSSIELIINNLNLRNIKTVHRDITVSRAEALNDAIKNRDSQYIAVIDDDDTWHPDYLKQMVEELEKRKLHGVVCRTNQVFERIKKSKLQYVKTTPWMKDLKVISLYQQCIDNQLTTVGFLYSRESYNAIDGYDESLNVLEDYEFGIRFLMKYDVDLIDPGYALANYHRRVVPRGENPDNSFVYDDHRYNFYKIANRMLRQELSEGRLGVGYIMSNVKYNQTYIAQAARRITPGFITKILKKRIQD